MIIYLFICLCQTVMVFVGYDQVWVLHRFQPPRRRLHHLDFAKRHIYAPSDERVINLFDQLAAMHQKQHGFAVVRKPFGNLRRDHRLAAAARQHHARRSVTVGVGFKQFVQQVVLIISQRHQNGRSSSPETSTKPFAEAGAGTLRRLASGMM